jgi:caffeoyl-CoA O-methyltransferase
MKHTATKCAVLIVGLGLAAVVVAVGQRHGFTRSQTVNKPPLAGTDAEKRVLSVIDRVSRAGEVYLEVPADTGRVLRLLAEASNAKQVVEVGTSTGYSGLWFCLALQATGGKLATFEIDAGRAAAARRHFEQAGVDNIVTVVEGDAHANVKQLKGPVDVVFLDADKGGYVDYLNTLLPLVRPGGLILADNVEMAPDYVSAVTTNPALETVFSQSLGVTLKKR